jgi:lipid A 3-O-deacylase
VDRRVIAVVFFVLVTRAGLAQEAKPAADQAHWIHEIRLGLLAHDVGGLWSGTHRENGVDGNAEVFFDWPGSAVLRGTLRSSAGLTLNSQGDTSKIYAGFIWEIVSAHGLFLDLGLGAAAHNGELETDRDDRKELGSRILFRIPIEAGITIHGRHRLSILFDHVSNAYLAHPNEGMDTVGLRYGYLF